MKRSLCFAGCILLTFALPILGVVAWAYYGRAYWRKVAQ